MSTTATDSAEKEMPLPYGNVKNGNKPRNTTTQANVVSLDRKYSDSMFEIYIVFIQTACSLSIDLRKFVASGHSSALELYEQVKPNLPLSYSHDGERLRFTFLGRP